MGIYSGKACTGREVAILTRIVWSRMQLRFNLRHRGGFPIYAGSGWFGLIASSLREAVAEGTWEMRH